MAQWRSMLVATVVVAMVLSFGCAPRKRPVPTTQPSVEPAPAETVHDIYPRIRELRSHLSAFSSYAGLLPGRDDESQRQLMAGAFGELDQMIVILNGPYPTSAMVEREKMVRQTAEMLAAGLADLPSDSLENTGLLSAEQSLTSLAERGLGAKENIDRLLNALRAKIRDMETTQSPTHRLLSADTMGLVGQVVYVMTESFAARAGKEPVPATRPAKVRTTAPAKTK